MKKHKKVFKKFKYISIPLIIINIFISVYLLLSIDKLNVLPFKYMLGLSLIMLLIDALIILFLSLKKIVFKIIGIILSIALIIATIIGITYIDNTNDFLLSSFNNNTIEVSNYNVIILNSSKYDTINDLKGKKIGYLKDEKDSLNKLNEEIEIIIKEYDDIFELYKAMLNKKVDSIILNEAYINILEEEYSDIKNVIKIIYNIDLKTIIEKKTENDQNLLKPLNIYISGSDSYSKKIVNKSRSDVNMILTINPNTNEIMLTSIPRDYYVQVYNKPGLKDKLTHSGIYGIGVTTHTIEDLFGIEINYSVKVGFNAVEEIVDLVGGIDVYSDKKFSSIVIPGFVVKKGTNHFNGAEALAYARERKAYTSGDRHRIQNQQQVLEAVLKKVLADKSLLLKYDKLLKSFSNLYRTDIPTDVITEYVKYQLETMNDWTFESQWVDGKGASLPTYTSPKNKRYVMIPDEDSIKKASKKINNLINKE